jgi:hypothetical protein
LGAAIEGHGGWLFKHTGDASTTAKNDLISGATGDTGRPAVKESVALGLTVRALVPDVGGAGRAAAVHALSDTDHRLAAPGRRPRVGRR